jgi:hypothetical protein
MGKTFSKLKSNFVDLVNGDKDVVQTYLSDDLDDNELNEAVDQISNMENLYKNLN